jgi:hypothetical protein
MDFDFHMKRTRGDWRFADGWRMACASTGCGHVGRLSGKHPGPGVWIPKLIDDEHGRHTMELSREWVGVAGLLEGAGPTRDVPGNMRAGR